jgi:hypothetical protein
MHSQFIEHDYRAPRVLAEERAKKVPRFLALHAAVRRRYTGPDTKRFMEPFLELAEIKRCVACGVSVNMGVRCCATARS